MRWSRDRKVASQDFEIAEMQLATSTIGVIAIVSAMISAIKETEREHPAELRINHTSRTSNPENEATLASPRDIGGVRNKTTVQASSVTTSTIVVFEPLTESLALAEGLNESRLGVVIQLDGVQGTASTTDTKQSQKNVDPTAPSGRKALDNAEKDSRLTRHLDNEKKNKVISEKNISQSRYSSVESSFQRSAMLTSSRPPVALTFVSLFNTSRPKSSKTEINGSRDGNDFVQNVFIELPANDAVTTSDVEASSPSNGDTSMPEIRVYATMFSTKKESQIGTSGKKGQNSRTWNELGSGKIAGSTRKDEKFVHPNITSALGKYAPFFEDGDQPQNVTARIGTTVKLDCRIGMLNNKTVAWYYHSLDDMRLLTVGRRMFSADQRISLSFQYPTNWGLQIQYASTHDSGPYECQVATFPPLIKKFNVLVTAPILAIMDDSGRIKSGERHLKAGSALRLKCEVKDIYNESVMWTRGDETLTDDVSENRTGDILDGREIQVVVSTLTIERATPRHAGNYSCVVPEKARATVAVHVLNGELPAAVHDGNGVSRSVLNLWLVYLTVSYVFSR